MLWLMEPTDQELREWATRRVRLWLRELVKRAMQALARGERG